MNTALLWVITASASMYDWLPRTIFFSHSVLQTVAAVLHFQGSRLILSGWLAFYWLFLWELLKRLNLTDLLRCTAFYIDTDICWWNDGLWYALQSAKQERHIFWYATSRLVVYGHTWSYVWRLHWHVPMSQCWWQSGKNIHM